MASLTRIIAQELGGAWQGAVAGQDIATLGVTPTLGTGDLIPINSGSGTLIVITSAGTGATATIDSVRPSSYGVDQDLAITVPATGTTIAFIDNDGSGRFDQGAGNAGLAKITFTANTNVKLMAVTIP